MSARNGSTDSATADVTQLWRSWLTETERQVNSFWGEVLGTEQFGRFSGNFVDGYAVIQQSLSRGMERYLNTFNLPTHSDITELGERLQSIEDRIASLEAAIRAIAEATGTQAGASVTPIRPRRTRKPREAPAE
jgi:hypothetical protein